MLFDHVSSTHGLFTLIYFYLAKHLFYYLTAGMLTNMRFMHACQPWTLPTHQLMWWQVSISCVTRVFLLIFEIMCIAYKHVTKGNYAIKQKNHMLLQMSNNVVQVWQDKKMIMKDKVTPQREIVDMFYDRIRHCVGGFSVVSLLYILEKISFDMGLCDCAVVIP